MTTQLPSSGIPWYPQPYQERGIQMLLEQGSVGLFLDPGLGKTSLVLAAIKILKAKGLISSVLIIAPLRPMYKVWPDEIKKWADFNHLVISILHGKNKEWNYEADADIYIINPEGLKWLFAKKPLRKFDVLCIDESTKFKSYSSPTRFKLLKNFLHLFNRRWILTGTPSPNGLEDLFPQIYILDLGRALGRFITHYRREFFDQSPYNIYEYKPKTGAFEQIVERMRPLIYQLSAEDHLNMPELVYRSIEVTLPPEALDAYRQLEKHGYVMINGIDFPTKSEGVASNKLHQIANGAIYLGKEERENEGEYLVVHDEKLDALESYLEELSGKPTLVIYEFNHDLIRIKERFGDLPVLGSGMSIAAMERLVDRFNAGTVPIMLGHPGSMGHGLNLQEACHHICWFSVPWDLDFYDQTIGRIYRQGQKSSHVYVYHLVAKSTKDVEILRTLDMKDAKQQTLLKALK